MATKKQIILPIALLAGGIALTIGLSAMKKPPEKKEQENVAPLVEVVPASITDLTLDVNSYGLVSPKYSTALVAQVSGQVVSLSDAFVEGAFVKKGDVLARIDPNDYEAALTEAEARLAQARSALEIERAQAKVAKAEWDRISQNADELIPTELYLRKPQLAEKLASFRAAEASLKRAKRNLERTYIRAPYDAIIESRLLSLGSVVNPGSSFGSVNGVDTAEVRLPVADKELQYLVNAGNGANVNLKAQYAGQDTQWQARIVRTEGVIDRKSRMTYLVAEVSDPYALNSEHAPLRFGSYVNATIEGRLVKNAVQVPQHLVRRGKIAVMTEDRTLTFKTINPIREQNGMVISDAGLSDTDQVIVSALEYPTEGMAVKLASDEEADKASQEDGETQIAMKEE